MTLSLLLSILLMPGAGLAEGGIVAGTLRGPDGSPAARVRVGVMSVPEPGRGVRGAGTLVRQVETDDAGRFKVEDVPPGRYYVLAGRLESPTYYPGVRDYGSAKTIQVAAKTTVRDIDFLMSGASVGSTPAAMTPSLPVVKVTGRVILKNNPEAPMPSNITLQAFPITANPAVVTPAVIAANRSVAASRIPVTLPVAPDGTFKADLVAADQHLSVVGLPAGYSVLSFTSGGTNLLTQPVDVKLGAELIVSLEVGDTRPQFRVVALVREDSSDRPLAGETVELVRPSGEVVRLIVNAQGTVTFSGLLQGAYVLRLASAGFAAPEKQVVISDSSVELELRARKRP